MPTPTTRLLAAPLVAALFALGACSGDGDEPEVASLDEDAGAGAVEAGGGVDADEALLDFSTCMRDEGVSQFPDLSVAENPFLQLADSGIDVQAPAVQAALERCSPLIEGVVTSADLDPEAQAELQDRILALTRCLQDEGYGVPDPDFSQGIGLQMFDLDQLDVDFGDPAFEAALRACFQEVVFPELGGQPEA